MVVGRRAGVEDALPGRATDRVSGDRRLVRGASDHHRLRDAAGGTSAIGDRQGHTDGLGSAVLKAEELRRSYRLAVLRPPPVEDAAIVGGTGAVEAAKEQNVAGVGEIRDRRLIGWWGSDRRQKSFASAFKAEV